jgi:hypothetical protein
MRIYILVTVLLGLDKVKAIDLLSLSTLTLLTEETRYIGSNGKPINLAQ